MNASAPEVAAVWLEGGNLDERMRELEQASGDLQRDAAMKDMLMLWSVGELRTPMSLIVGYVQLMEAHPRLSRLFGDDPETRQLLDGMKNAVTRMQAVMTESTLLARVLAGRVELTFGRVKVAELVARAVSGFTEPMRQREITLRFERMSFPNVIDADETLLEIVFRNLLGNAVKFSPNGGTITLAARVIPGAAPGGVLRFSVRDNGVGIAPENLERIFGAFVSLPPVSITRAAGRSFATPGMGLGLAVSKQIVEAHHGRLWAESTGCNPETCPGSEFILVLPVKAQHSA